MHIRIIQLAQGKQVSPHYDRYALLMPTGYFIVWIGEFNYVLPTEISALSSDVGE
jgi:hypothetical protein